MQPTIFDHRSAVSDVASRMHQHAAGGYRRMSEGLRGLRKIVMLIAAGDFASCRELDLAAIKEVGSSVISDQVREPEALDPELLPNRSARPIIVYNRNASGAEELAEYYAARRG